MPDALFWSFWLKSALWMWTYCTVWFGVSLVFGKKRVGLPLFGVGLLICIWVTHLTLHNLSWAAWIVGWMVTLSGIWQTYAVLRSPKNPPKEFKKDWLGYTKEYGNFLGRGLLVLIVVLPAMQAIVGYAILSGLFYAGVVVWLIGFGMAMVGKIYYLGEVVQWLGLWLIALTTAGGMWTIISPTLLLLVFSSKHSEKFTGENLIKN